MHLTKSLKILCKKKKKIVNKVPTKGRFEFTKSYFFFIFIQLIW